MCIGLCLCACEWMSICKGKCGLSVWVNVCVWVLVNAVMYRKWNDVNVYFSQIVSNTRRNHSHQQLYNSTQILFGLVRHRRQTHFRVDLKAKFNEPMRIGVWMSHHHTYTAHTAVSNALWCEQQRFCYYTFRLTCCVAFGWFECIGCLFCILFSPSTANNRMRATRLKCVSGPHLKHPMYMNNNK